MIPIKNYTAAILDFYPTDTHNDYCQNVKFKMWLLTCMSACPFTFVTLPCHLVTDKNGLNFCLMMIMSNFCPLKQWFGFYVWT